MRSEVEAALAALLARLVTFATALILWSSPFSRRRQRRNFNPFLLALGIGTKMSWHLWATIEVLPRMFGPGLVAPIAKGAAGCVALTVVAASA